MENGEGIDKQENRGKPLNYSVYPLVAKCKN